EVDPLKYVPLNKVMGEDWPIFYLLIAIAMVPRIRAHHKRLGVPERVTRECCSKIRDECEDYRRGRGGRLGIFAGELGWLANYVNGETFFRLGRFEYWRKPFRGHFKVYRSRKDGRIVALAGPAWKIDPSGWIEGIGGEAEGASIWRTTLKRIGRSVHGFRP
ncbi:MAG: acyltransferase domain-containing protein, partial [Thermoproteota archaeon]